MSNDFIFSWAEDANGNMVHVDTVPRGAQCNCICPYCHEKLNARHGEINSHGFAHQSNERKANLKICYMVTLYKLAEQIVQEKKRIHTPSYYGIFKENDIQFVDIKIDSRFEREDKQPDVIATTCEDNQYIIEFFFEYKIRHKKAINYNNLSFLEVDLSNQNLESLEDFLLSSANDRTWVNNAYYFNQLEEVYRKHGKAIKVVSVDECQDCTLASICCAVKSVYNTHLNIKNNGRIYRICKIDEFNRKLKEQEQKRLQEEQRRLLEEQRRKESEKARFVNWEKEKSSTIQTNQMTSHKPQVIHQAQLINESECDDSSTRTCYDCKMNLTYMNRDGFAYCGSYSSLKTPQRPNPDYAKSCTKFRKLKR